MSPSLDKRNCCVFWTLKWDHMHFVYFFVWHLATHDHHWEKYFLCDTQVLSPGTSGWFTHARVQFELFLWWRWQNWNTSTMCCLVPGAQLLVMELEFPKIWDFFPLVERKKIRKKIPPIAQMWRLTEIKHWIEGLLFSICSEIPWTVKTGAGDTPSIYRLWSHMHVRFPISNLCVSRSHQVYQLLPLQHQHIQFTEKSVVNFKKENKHYWI